MAAATSASPDANGGRRGRGGQTTPRDGEAAGLIHPWLHDSAEAPPSYL
jgi:hypothetical protein